MLPKAAAFEDMLIPFKNAIEITRVLESIGPTVTVRSNKTWCHSRPTIRASPLAS